MGRYLRLLKLTFRTPIIYSILTRMFETVFWGVFFSNAWYNCHCPVEYREKLDGWAILAGKELTFFTSEGRSVRCSGDFGFSETSDPAKQDTRYTAVRYNEA